MPETRTQSYGVQYSRETIITWPESEELRINHPATWPNGRALPRDEELVVASVRIVYVWNFDKDTWNARCTITGRRVRKDGSLGALIEARHRFKGYRMEDSRPDEVQELQNKLVNENWPRTIVEVSELAVSD